MNDEEYEPEGDSEEWTYVEAKPLSGINIVGYVIQAGGNVLATLGATLHAVSQEFFMAGLHQQTVRETFEKTRFEADTMRDINRLTGGPHEG